MNLVSALLETINQEWQDQTCEYLGGSWPMLSIVYIHPSLAEAIKNEGDELPKEFDPNEYNMLSDKDYATVEIRVRDIDGLISFVHE